MIRLENVLKISLLDVLKMSWRRKAKGNIFLLIKTSWRHLQDVFWRRRRKTSSRRLQEVFIKTNVCWETTLPTKSSWWSELLFNKNILAGKQTNYLLLRKVADEMNFYLIKIYRFQVLTDLNERYQKKKKHI